MLIQIPGKEITPTELSKEITVAILRQSKSFTVSEIVDTVCPEVLPLEFRIKGYIDVPGDELFVLIPNRSYLEKLVNDSISRMLESGNLTVINDDLHIYAVK